MDAQTIKSLVAIFLAAILTENYILNKFLGICPFLGVSKKLDTAVGMSCAVTVVMVISTAVTWPLYTYLLVPNGLGYLQTIVFILVIAALVQLLETALRKYMPPLYNALGIYLPLITTNCAVLGVTMLVLEKGAEDPTFGYLQSLVNAFGSGVGFLVAMVLFAGVRERLENCDIPETFKGPAHHLGGGQPGGSQLPGLQRRCGQPAVKGGCGYGNSHSHFDCGHHRPAGRRHSGGGLHRHGGAQGRKGRSPGGGPARGQLRRLRVFRLPGLRGGHGQGRGPAGLCSPGGAEVAQKCAEILGGGDVQVEYKTALVHCLGSYDNTTDKMAVRRHPKLLGGGLPHGGRHQLPFWLHGLGDCQRAASTAPSPCATAWPALTRPSARAAPSAWRPAPRGLSLWCP